MLPAGSPWLVVRLWAHHPDVTEIPVGVTLSTACGVVWSGDLRTRDTVDIGVTLPDRLRVVDATVSVSRTWQPSDHGSADTRHLGVGIDTEFVDSPDDVRGRAQTAAWPVCR
jgi:hypothetical protein